jgi:hypothetical protein
MTTQEIVTQGLSLIDKPQDFLRWADQWYHDAPSWCGIHTSIREWAWVARDMAGDKWLDAVVFVARAATGQDDYCGALASTWLTRHGTPYHWVIAGVLALNILKQESKVKP